MNQIPTITAARAADLVKNGAVLIDIREADEYAREHIPGARHHPLSRLDKKTLERPSNGVVVFHCRSGARTQSNAARLASAAQNCEAYALEGGLNAWKKAGLPIALDRRQPIDIMRQVQIVAGSLVLLGAGLGFFVAPVFYALSAFVGAGLLFAGLTGFCGMATVLGWMPWNRRAAAGAP